MLRAGLPTGWRVGDKTGRGGHGSTNDVAVIWPAGQARFWTVAAYLTECTLPMTEREAAIAQVGRLLAAEAISGA